MGFDNQFTARVVSLNDRQVHIEAGRARLIAQTYAALNATPGDQVSVLFRPETASLQKDAGANTIPGEIIFRNFQGSIAQYLIRSEVGEFTVAVTETQQTFSEGPIHISIKPENLIVARYSGE
jgi:ABC-type Fe3+/spermidine/putrescine transport system ATPase subunit